MKDKKDEQDTKSAPELWRTAFLYAFASFAFAAVAGLIYATGFLVEFTFLDSLGIKSPNSETSQAKYIYIGLLCLQFPLSAFLLNFGVRKMRQLLTDHHLPKTEEERKKYKTGRDMEIAAMKEARRTDMWPRKTTTLLLLLFLFAFYVLIAFTRPGMGSFHENKPLYFFLFVVSFLGIRVARGAERIISRLRSRSKWVDDLFNSDKDEHYWGELARRTILVSAAAITVWVFWNLWGLLGWMLWSGGYLYLGLAYLAAIMARWAVGLQRSGYIQGIRAPAICASLGVSLALLYFAVVSFSYTFYRYIPTNRGGGDYTLEKSVILSFDPQFSNAVPSQVIGTNLQSKAVIVLHESPNWLHVAIPFVLTNATAAVTNGPVQWRESGPNNKPKLLFAIKREAIVGTSQCTEANLIYQVYSPNEVPRIQ